MKNNNDNKKRQFKNIQNFIENSSAKSLKKMDKDERLGFIARSMPELIAFHKKDGRFQPELLVKVYERMGDAKIAKGIAKLAKDNGLEIEAAPLIYEFLDSYYMEKGKQLEGEEKEAHLAIANMYLSTVQSILNKRAKKMAKKLNITEDFAMELLTSVPSKEYVDNPKVLGIYVGKLTRQLYSEVADGKTFIVDAAVDSSPDLYRKIFKYLFEKDFLSNIAINILLEYKDNLKGMKENQKTIWNALTTFALEELDSYKSDALKELVIHYINRRKADAKKNKDQARRVVLSESIDQESYPNLFKVATKLKKKDEYKEFI
jgi:hypothetical protein